MNRNNTALVVIDIVNSTCHEKCETPEYGITFNKIREMVPRLAKFVDDYRDGFNKNIYFVNLTPWTKEYLPQNIQNLYENPDVEYYGGDSFEEEFYVVQPQETDTIITKNTYDAFSVPEFEKSLRAKGIQNLVICGVFTDGCVLSTIINGFSRGFDFIILKDIVETTDSPVRQELQTALLEYTLPMQYGKVMTGDELLEGQK
ncbi:MAG: cysteine hydrolase [Candidatus Nomurabacteria bacterium]|jgi:nicotinamidase-related amidase|nr:cysteine hydrolase [Candidatus Nomurabacteria bacterium]